MSSLACSDWESTANINQNINRTTFSCCPINVWIYPGHWNRWGYTGCLLSDQLVETDSACHLCGQKRMSQQQQKEKECVCANLCKNLITVRRNWVQLQFSLCNLLVCPLGGRLGQLCLTFLDCRSLSVFSAQEVWAVHAGRRSVCMLHSDTLMQRFKLSQERLA